MADYSFSREARVDLLEIWDYINVSAADRVTEEIKEAVEMLVRNPELGHIRKDLTSMLVRFWPIYSYLIVYDPAVKPIEIVRVLSGYIATWRSC